MPLPSPAAAPKPVPAADHYAGMNIVVKKAEPKVSLGFWPIACCAGGPVARRQRSHPSTDAWQRCPYCNNTGASLTSAGALLLQAGSAYAHMMAKHDSYKAAPVKPTPKYSPSAYQCIPCECGAGVVSGGEGLGSCGVLQPCCLACYQRPRSGSAASMRRLCSAPCTCLQHPAEGAAAATCKLCCTAAACRLVRNVKCSLHAENMLLAPAPSLFAAGRAHLDHPRSPAPPAVPGRAPGQLGQRHQHDGLPGQHHQQHRCRDHQRGCRWLGSELLLLLSLFRGCH